MCGSGVVYQMWKWCSVSVCVEVVDNISRCGSGVVYQYVWKWCSVSVDVEMV